MKVFVYYNLHKHCWSVKSLEKENYGRVIDHTDKIVLENCIFKVQKGGRARVLREKRKNVHAGVVGYYNKNTPKGYTKWNRVTYDPYLYETFVEAANKNPIHNAQHVVMKDKKVYAI